MYVAEDVSTSREGMDEEEEEEGLPNVLGVDSMRAMHT
jgi:hypothetical protein